MKYTLKELIGGTQADFLEYRKGNLWYVIKNRDNFTFPVPIEDVGDGIFKTTEKSLLLMRYIRKHLDNVKKGAIA